MKNKHLLEKLVFMLVTDRNGCKQPFLKAIELALAGNVRTIQIREKDLTTRELYTLATRMRQMTFDFNANLIVNDRLDIALAVDADGVHLGWQSLPIETTRKLIGSDKILGVSTHNPQEALHAQNFCADYITFGPVFETSSKAGFILPTGVKEIQRLKEQTGIRIPVIALGGINAKNVESVFFHGADGIAVISSIMHADDPKNSALCLSRQIEGLKEIH